MANKIDKETFFEYQNWEEAVLNSTGYSNVEVLEEYKKINSALKFDEIICYEPRYIELFCALQRCKNDIGSHRIADFGGGNGYLGYAAKKFLNYPIIWEVFEISEFVEIYKNIGQGDILFKNFEEYEKSNYNITLFSCSIQYCQEPYEIFEKAIKKSDFVILSRIPFIKKYKEKITVQEVELNHKSFSWPAYFFGEKFFDYIKEKGDIVYRWETPSEQVIFKGEIINYQGLVIKK